MRNRESRPTLYGTGFLEGQEKRAALAHASLAVLPSYSENFGVAAAEAMACGLPLIVSTGVGIHREVSAAGAGLVVPCEETRLADSMFQVLGDAGMRDRMVRDGFGPPRLLPSRPSPAN